MAQLNVNIDHVATVRQARLADEPDPVWAASECALAGANGITMHLREDRRHVQDRDVKLVRQSCAVKFNLEMAMSEEIIRLAVRLKPDQITLVPEKRKELTTEGGLDCVRLRKQLVRVVQRMHRAGILVSAFIIPDAAQVSACSDCGCDAVELHTGPYANAKNQRETLKRIKELEKARDVGWDCGLDVHAGHGLNYRNISPIAQIEGIEDFNIGHSIVARAIFVGIRQATRQMLELIQRYGL